MTEDSICVHVNGKSSEEEEEQGAETDVPGDCPANKVGWYGFVRSVW